MSDGIHAVFEDHYIEEALKNGTMRSLLTAEEMLKNGTMRKKLTAEAVAQQTDPEFAPTNKMFTPTSPAPSSSCSAPPADLPPSNTAGVSPPQSTKLPQGPSKGYHYPKRQWGGTKNVVVCEWCNIRFYDGLGLTHCCSGCCRAHRYRRPIITHSKNCFSRRC